MLTWMERHPYPFVCTTNLMDSLDPATLRRFLFKVEFLPMTTAQAREAFRRAFLEEAPAALDRLDPLTPGDFTTVARKTKILGVREPGASSPCWRRRLGRNREQRGRGSDSDRRKGLLL